MIDLCLEQLAAITEGRLRLGTMPPLAGSLEPIRRIVVNPQMISAQDVFWWLGVGRGETWMEVQTAFGRGAVGVVVDTPGLEPWAGKFVLEVPDSAAALTRLMRCLQQTSRTTVVRVCGLPPAVSRGLARRDPPLGRLELREAWDWWHETPA